MSALNCLKLDELRRLSDQLTAIVVAGFRLEQDGLDPRFDLTPGMPIRITLGAVMPLAERPDFGAWLASQPQSTEAASADAAPVDAPLARGDRAEGAPISAGPSRAIEEAMPPRVAEPVVVPAESGGEVGNGSGSRLPAAPVPGSASALAASSVQWAGAWTREQDAQLAGAVADAQINGRLKADAIRDVASALGRSFKATEQRAYRISGTIKAEVARRAMTQAQTESPEIPAADPPVDPAEALDVPQPEVVAATFNRPMAAPPDDLHGFDLELWRFLQEHRPRWPMTAGTDLDLVMGLGRGEKLPMIAADLGIDVEALKRRYQVLTSRILDARGNVTIDGGPRLIALLRRIAKTPAEAA